jgi:PAS domain S-box-containing protein
VEEHVWGVLEFTSRDPREPDGGLLRTSGILGGQVGMFIKRLDSEQRLRETNAFQRAILASAQYAIIATTSDGLIRTFTRGAERMLGYKAEELVGKHTPAFFHDPLEVAARGETLSRQYGREIRGFEVFVHHPRNGHPEEREWTYVRKDGTRFPVIISVAGLFDANGRITGFLGIAADITERKRALEELKLAKDAAESASRAKTEFLTTISHEIRTPMNGVMGMTGLLLQTPLSPRQRELAEAVSYSADALLDVINDVLDFSKIEAGKLSLSEEDFALHPLVDGVLEVASHRDPEKNLSLTATIDRSLPERMIGDPIRLRQILINLVGNGVKFTDRGEVRTKVSLLKQDSDQIVLRFEVIDTGIGLDEDQTSRLFQPFVQADGSSARRFAGSGLGLAISRRLIELMHGRIGVTSKPGIGSNFWFEVPFQRTTESETPPSPRLGFARVIVASPNAGLLESLQEQLLGWEITPAKIQSTGEILELLSEAATASTQKTILLLDEPLWREGGNQLQSSINATRAQISTILLARPSSAVNAPPAIQAAFSAILTKPLKHLQLRQQLCAISGHSPLPVSPQPSANAESNVPLPILTQARILLAEDNPINRRFCLLVLEGLGTSADTAVNGLDALKRVGQKDYDIILMDCNMPELDGYDTTRAIRQLESLRHENRRRHTRIIALTANAVVGERERCLEAGMDDYLSKPINSTQLKEALIRHAPAPRTPAPSAPDTVSPTESTPATSIAPNTPPIMHTICDISRLQQLCDEIDAEAVHELAHDFLRELPERVQEMRALSSTGPITTFRRAAHSLKGSSASMGLDELAAHCAELELASDSNDPILIQSLLAALPAIADSATSSLTQWLMKSS